MGEYANVVPCSEEDFFRVLAMTRLTGNVRKAIRTCVVDMASFYCRVGMTDENRAELNKARMDGLDSLADECIALGDEARRHVTRKRVTEGKGDKAKTTTTVEIEDNVERTRLQIHTRYWLLARLHPAKYGEHISVDQTIRQEEAKKVEQELENGRKRLALVKKVG